MKNFLIVYEKQKYSIVEKSENVLHLEKNNVILLFLTTQSTENQKNNNLLDDYQRHGIDFIKDIKDSFSLFIYDKNIDKIFIAKDKVGIQPLYFSQYANTIIIGTSLKQFPKISTFNPILNNNSIAQYLQYGLILQPNTIFQNCHKVKSGSYVSFDLKTQKYISTSYWRLEDCYLEEKSTASENEILHNSHNLLSESLEKNMQKHKIGFALSGGYDSSALVAMAQASSEKKINTFSIGFKEQSINEAPHAKEISNYLGTNHTEHYFTAKDAVEIIPDIAKMYDEPFADHAVAPTILISQLLKQDNITKLIAGDGGDEVFATADELKSFERFKQTPEALKKFIASSLKILPTPNKLKSKKNKLSQMLMAKNIASIIKVRKSLFLEEELSLYIKNLKPKIYSSFDEINFPKNAETVDQIIGTYFKTTMTDGELVKSHTAVNHLNINLAVPFLDTKLIEYMATVPSSLKVKNGIKKYLLKEITYQYLPKKLIEKPKTGFDIPFSLWMKKELKDLVYLQINKKRLDEDNIFYTSSILNIRDQFYAGDNTYKYKLWRIFIFQLWYHDLQQTIKG
ncbi:MAG TPA: hypothetical protein EYG73_08950 [Arcobacter sp.]|nr:hypothetical protein [Arcobacter sp.]